MPKKSTAASKSGTAPSTTAKTASATGSPITPKLFAFLKELKENNNREWFTENKSRYESEVLNPAIALVAALQPRIAKISRYILAEPKRSGGSIMRIYRDTRFAKDKTPYKTNVGIYFKHAIGGDIHAPGLYMHLEPGKSFLAAGIWMPPTEPLTAIRQAIMDEPKAWNRVKKDKAFAARFKFGGDSLKTAPRGIDPEHPEIEDLRRKSFIGGATFGDRDYTKTNAVEAIADAFSDAKPLLKFLCDALQQPF